MLSPETTVRSWEIWILVPGLSREVFDLQRSCESKDEADRLASAIADWLHLGTWYDAVLDTLPPDAQDQLFALRQGFRADGVDLGTVQVGAKPEAAALFTQEEDDFDAEDTALEHDAPRVTYDVGGDGHAGDNDLI